MITDRKAAPCLCDTPCTVCGTLYFDDITLEERTDCEQIVPLPAWHEFLTDEQVDAMQGDSNCNPRVETDPSSDVGNDGTTDT